jgi:16S rRNA (guanine(966)-N(2))-methyltransferase RsmD
MAKESLFNILNNHYFFEDLSVLDLFSGTGNLAYEFASRGAVQVTAVDINAHCVRYIDRTTQQLDFPITVIKSDVFKYLERARMAVDIVIADPPYDLPKAEFEKIVTMVFENSLLKEDGVLILEHSKHTDFSDLAHFSDARKYGGSVFSFFYAETKEEEEED